MSSGFRCPQLNSLIHGATQSQHLRGEAVDTYTDAGPVGNLEVARLIIASGCFDQVILENVPGNQLLPQWIHVSWKRLGANRREIRMVYATIRQHSDSEDVSNNDNGQLNGQLSGQLSGQLNDSQKETLAFIEVHEGYNTTKIAEGLGKPFRTIDKHIRVLLEFKLIVRRGSKKTGGFYVKR